MPLTLIPLALLIIPVLEIGVFVVIGSEIGVFATLSLVLITAIIGTVLLRLQGLVALGRIRIAIDDGRLPGLEIGHGVLIMVAGILLLTPGFVTDSIGFLLFVPLVRTAIWGFAARHIHLVGNVVAAGGGGANGGMGNRFSPKDGAGPGPGGKVVDLDPEDYGEAADPNSPWRPKD